ncbi:Putative ABC transporter arginine-binding protein 2 [Paraburkholderia aspalathi]|uniref:ABC transporter substrate-binding protein n=1 Tax=Paraburkholderia aspalathi TaxID=1324617 RepID=UPI001B0D4C16|nr:ABC transporter substrate-binding protein [Paraburkholderia aspalathi]MBK3843875.1 ABC transporter substrate-binding protein [Paraburkholderia aspalathi]CAE6862732.1 Putative ABC transporter arginine-binding protein 2 [Paraburkholderia aspalathi]
MIIQTGFRLAMSAFAIVCACAAGAAHAQVSKTIINAATVPKYPPFEFRDPASNKLIGFDVDIVDALAAKMGAKVNWVESSFDQLISSITTKRVDVIVAGMNDLPERRANVSFLDYLQSNTVFFTLRPNLTRFPTMDLLCGQRVATARRTVWPEAITKWSDEHCVKAGKPAVNIVGTDGSPDTRLQLNQGRADAAVQGAETIVYQNSVENNRYAVVGTPFMVQQMGLGFDKKDPQFGEALKKALAALIADGTYQKLVSKWGLNDSAIRQPMINGQP